MCSQPRVIDFDRRVAASQHFFDIICFKNLGLIPSASAFHYKNVIAWDIIKFCFFFFFYDNSSLQICYVALISFTFACNVRKKNVSALKHYRNHLLSSAVAPFSSSLSFIFLYVVIESTWQKKKRKFTQDWVRLYMYNT